MVEDRYLLDTTLDQVNQEHRHLKAKPLVIDLRETKWFDPLLALLTSVQIRYTKFPRQVGWLRAGDFQPRRRHAIVETLIELSKTNFIYGRKSALKSLR